MDWSNTRLALDKLILLLKCTGCDKPLENPCFFESCDHLFCRSCATDIVNKGSKCPKCSAISWIKGLQESRQMLHLVESCNKLSALLRKHEKFPVTSTDITKSSPDKLAQDFCLQVNAEVLPKQSCQSEFLKLPDVDMPLISAKHARDETAVHVSQNSQFSKVLNSDDLALGAQRNPSRKYKSPKITYGKTKSFARSEPKTAEWFKDASVFEFTTANSVNEKEQKSIASSDRSGLAHGDVPCSKKGNNRKVRSLSPLESNRSCLRRKSVTSVQQISVQDFQDGKGVNCNSGSMELGKRKSSGGISTKSLSKRNKKGETSLHVACIKGDYSEVVRLLNLGSDPNTKDNAGWTPLHEASNHGRTNIVEALLDQGALIDMVGGVDNDTPLHDAVANNRLETVRLLIARGAPKDVRNSNGLLPVDYAVTREMREAFSDGPLLDVSACGSSLDTDVMRLSCANARKVIVFTGMSSTEKSNLALQASELQGEVRESFSEDVTHVVCKVDDQAVATKRTIKYMFGLLHGRWIVSCQWLIDSRAKGIWLPEIDYETLGCVDSGFDVPRKARMNKYKQLPSLFTGCSFYFSGQFGASPGKAHLIQLVKAGNGKLLHREPRVSDADPLIAPPSPALRKMNILKKPALPFVVYHARPDSAASVCLEYILYDPKMSPGHRKISSPLLATAPVTWLLDCVSHFEVLDVRDDQENRDGLTCSQ